LMAKALNDYTAFLPMVSLESGPSVVPGTSTVAAIKAGIHSAVTGGVSELILKMRSAQGTQVEVFITGGDAALVAPALSASAIVWPEMTLDGIRLSAQALPEQ